MARSNGINRQQKGWKIKVAYQELNLKILKDVSFCNAQCVIFNGWLEIFDIEEKLGEGLWTKTFCWDWFVKTNEEAIERNS